MFQKNQVTICDHHCAIMYFAETLKDLLNQNLTKAELYDKINTIADGIYEESQEALIAGQHLEDRCKLYRTTIEGLGFKRV